MNQQFIVYFQFISIFNLYMLHNTSHPILSH